MGVAIAGPFGLPQVVAEAPAPMEEAPVITPSGERFGDALLQLSKVCFLWNVMGKGDPSR